MLFHRRLSPEDKPSKLRRLSRPFCFLLIPFSISSIVREETVARTNANAGSDALDQTYNDIRNEAVHAGVLLKATDEKIDELILNGQTIRSHANAIQAQTISFYRRLIRSENIARYCHVLTITLIIILAVVFIGKMLVRNTN